MTNAESVMHVLRIVGYVLAYLAVLIVGCTVTAFLLMGLLNLVQLKAEVAECRAARQVQERQ